jgi:hypothetical protein
VTINSATVIYYRRAAGRCGIKELREAAVAKDRVPLFVMSVPLPAVALFVKCISLCLDHSRSLPGFA